MTDDWLRPNLINVGNITVAGSGNGQNVAIASNPIFIGGGLWTWQNRHGNDDWFWRNRRQRRLALAQPSATMTGAAAVASATASGAGPAISVSAT